MEVVIIAAVAKNRVIGYQGKIPWKIPEDLRRFKQLTRGHTVIMGRKTWESLRKPLPERRNLVLSRQEEFHPAGAEVFSNLSDALQGQQGIVFIIGGAEIYREAWPRADRLEITEVDQEPRGDAFFPEVDWSQWQEAAREGHEGYAFVTWVRT